jgi:hypothetical protein
MKFCHLWVNGWNRRTSSSMKLVKFRRPKATCFLSYVEYSPNMNTSNIIKETGHAKGRSLMGEGG